MNSDSIAPNYEMATVLFVDIVGYSILPIDQQTKILRLLQQVVKQSASYQQAKSKEELIAIPAGDGMALVFLRSPVMAAKCALEIAAALRDQPEVQLRMGVNTGPVCQHADIKESINIVGGGINTAQRVMDSGDAGHILVSRTVAEVLEQFSGWHECLRDLGEQEVKHNVRVHLYNLCKDGLGNPQVPSKMRRDFEVPPFMAEVAPEARSGWRWKWLLAGALVAILTGSAFLIYKQIGPASTAANSPKSSASESAGSTAPADAMNVIHEWVASFEAKDLQRHMALYADSLDRFYTKRLMPKNEVAANIQTMFDQNSSFGDFQLSTWSSRELPQGRLLVEFDKQYKAMDKAGVSNEGKVRSELILQRFNDAWKIVSENDTKVYWTNKAERTGAAPVSGAVASEETAKEPAPNPLPPDKSALNEQATYRDPDSYIEFQYPSRLLHAEKTVDAHEVVRLKSDDGVLVSVSIVAADGGDALGKAYRLDLETPGRQITYKTGPGKGWLFRKGWYVMSGRDASTTFYRRVLSTRGHIAAMTFVHDSGLKPSFNFAPLIAPTFRALEGR
ncbi:MAG TPA: adenylate/guanylate cyclase domain-containing protein [Bryobacteraceae bacterium]|nr:adenylate/guanylate cyclase domain-containing protein [Bryobacteraceae bacterium]